MTPTFRSNIGQLEQERHVAHIGLALLAALMLGGQLVFDLMQNSERVVQSASGTLLALSVAALMFYRVLSVNLLTMLMAYLMFLWVFADCLLSLLNQVPPHPHFYIIYILANMMCFSWLSIQRAVPPSLLINVMLLLYVYQVASYDLPIVAAVLFTNFFMGFVTIFGRRISEARLRSELLQEMSQTDLLTSTLNRRSAWEGLSTLLKSREGAILLISINDLRQINRRFGHSVGDEVLVQLAHTLRTCVGKGAIISRWSGDEFLLIVEHIAAAEVERLAQRLMQAAAEIRIRDHWLSISVGTALSKEASNRDTLVALADHRVNQAKVAAGRYDLSPLHSSS